MINLRNNCISRECGSKTLRLLVQRNTDEGQILECECIRCGQKVFIHRNTYSRKEWVKIWSSLYA